MFPAMEPRVFRSVAVFCGSSDHARPSHFEAARAVGRGLAERGIRLIYGGGRVGLMGAIADAALAAGGQVVGVIPEKLQGLEVGHRGLTELHVVADMHSRKELMARLSEAFIALPGGFGTLDEIFEATTWTQLNYHLKPVGLLNVDGFYDALVAFLSRAAADGFIRPQHQDLLQVDARLEGLLDRLATCTLRPLRLDPPPAP